MTNHDERRQQERLDPYWDAVADAVSGPRDGPEPGLMQALDDIYHLDDAPPPTTAFVGELRARLLARHAGRAPATAANSASRQTKEVPAIGVVAPLSWPVPLRRPVGQLLTASILLLLGLVSIQQVLNGGDGPPATLAAPAMLTAPGTPIPLEAAECRVEPRSLESFEVVVSTPVAVSATPPPATPVPMPAGEPAAAETVAAITATVSELIACRNAVDIGRYYALWTDDGISRLYTLVPEALGPEVLQSVRRAETATPTPLGPDAAWTVEEIANVRVLADGRVGAHILLSIQDRPVTFYWIFARQRDRYLIDDTTLVVLEGLEGTPAAP